MKCNKCISDKYDDYESEGRLKNLYVVMVASEQKPEDDDFDDDGDYAGNPLTSAVLTLVVRAISGKKASEVVLRELRELDGEYHSYTVTDVSKPNVDELSALGDFVDRHSHRVSEAEYMHFISTAEIDSYLVIAAD